MVNIFSHIFIEDWRASTVEIFGLDYKLNLKTEPEFELESELENLSNKFRLFTVQIVTINISSDRIS